MNRMSRDNSFVMPETGDGNGSSDDEVSFASSYDDEEDADQDDRSQISGATVATQAIVQQQWKPRSETTYETLVMTSTEFNSK